MAGGGPVGAGRAWRAGLSCLTLVAVCLLSWSAQAQQQAAPEGLVERLAPLVAERLGALREKGPSQPAGVPFLVRLAGEVGEIEAGTAVRIRGIPVGRVREVQIRFDTGAATLDVPVVIELTAGRLTVDGQTPSTPEQTYDAVAALVAKGLRARVAAGGLMGGSPFIALDLVPDAPPAVLERGGAYPVIPSVPPQPDPLRAALDRLILRVNALPLEELARNAQVTLAGLQGVLTGPEAKTALDNLVATTGELRSAAGRLDEVLPPLAESAQATLVDVRSLVAGPEARAALANLVAATDDLRATAGRLDTQAEPLIRSLTRTADSAGAAAAQASRTMAQLDRTVGAQAPLWTQVQALLSELTGASRAARLLTEYLERHPDALIRGKSEQAP